MYKNRIFTLSIEPYKYIFKFIININIYNNIYHNFRDTQNVYDFFRVKNRMIIENRLIRVTKSNLFNHLKKKIDQPLVHTTAIQI